MQAFGISGGNQPRWVKQNDEQGIEMNAANGESNGTAENGAPKEPTEEETKPPPMSLFRLFQIFLWFGIRAFGGPVAQINMMKQELVVEQKWTTVAKFNRVLAVYQILPG
jgi:hypothetical protein